MGCLLHRLPGTWSSLLRHLHSQRPPSQSLLSHTTSETPSNKTAGLCARHCARPCAYFQGLAVPARWPWLSPRCKWGKWEPRGGGTLSPLPPPLLEWLWAVPLPLTPHLLSEWDCAERQAFVLQFPSVTLKRGVRRPECCYVPRGRCEPSALLLEPDLDLGGRAGQGYSATPGGWAGERLTAVGLLSVNAAEEDMGTHVALSPVNSRSCDSRQDALRWPRDSAPAPRPGPES